MHIHNTYQGEIIRLSHKYSADATLRTWGRTVIHPRHTKALQRGLVSTKKNILNSRTVNGKFLVINLLQNRQHYKDALQLRKSFKD